MPTRLKRETAEQAIQAVNACIKEGFSLDHNPGAIHEAAQRLEMSAGTLSKRLIAAKAHYGLRPGEDKSPPIQFPEFPDEDIPIEQIIDLASERFVKRRASFDAHTWFPIGIRDKLPIGICWFGDPHLDDNGCNWPMLRQHIEVCKNTTGLYGASVGDMTNNWAGRLIKLYAEQDSSVATARRLAEWFLLNSGVAWLLLILGNHDTWGDGAAILQQMAKRFGTHKLICHDWEVRFRLAFPNGWEPRIFASHNFKGNSIWNPMHGPMREGQIGEDADLYICGDRHTSGVMGFENVARGRFQNFVRVRGFKFMDDYARRHGFKEQSTGSSCVTIFDPTNQSVSVHMDVEEGADFLTWKRQRA